MTNNILITGIPRSGTSLLTSLLSDDQSICFSEPPWLKTLKESSDDGQSLLENLTLKIQDLRYKIKQGIPIEMIYKTGTTKLPDNYFQHQKSSINNLRETKQVLFPKGCSNNKFIIKANALFTANLTTLSKSNNWKICALVRDPVATLMSWRSLNIASSKGRVRSVEKYSPELKFIGTVTPLLKRQVLLLDWYFKQFDTLIPEKVIKYEALVKDPSLTILSKLGEQISSPLKLKSQNNNNNYNQNEKHIILSAIHKYSKHLKKFYPNSF